MCTLAAQQPETDETASCMDLALMDMPAVLVLERSSCEDWAAGYTTACFSTCARIPDAEVLSLHHRHLVFNFSTGFTCCICTAIAPAAVTLQLPVSELETEADACSHHMEHINGYLQLTCSCRLLLHCVYLSLLQAFMDCGEKADKGDSEMADCLPQVCCCSTWVSGPSAYPSQQHCFGCCAAEEGLDS